MLELDSKPGSIDSLSCLSISSLHSRPPGFDTPLLGSGSRADLSRLVLGLGNGCRTSQIAGKLRSRTTILQSINRVVELAIFVSKTPVPTNAGGGVRLMRKRLWRRLSPLREKFVS